MKTGNTRYHYSYELLRDMPQWSPVMKTGNTRVHVTAVPPRMQEPQWSPVMKTGNTCGRGVGRPGTGCLNGARS